MDRMQKFLETRAPEEPSIIDAERLIMVGDNSGAGKDIDAICDRDPRNARSIRDRFALYIYQQGIEAAAKKKREERQSKELQARIAWEKLFKDNNLDPI